MLHYDESVRRYIVQMISTGIVPLKTEKPIIPDDLRLAVENVENACVLSRGDTKKIKSFVHAAVHDQPDLEELFEPDLEPAPKSNRPAPLCDVPTLPESILVAMQAATITQSTPIYNEMVGYIRSWATSSYDGYHEAAALWVLATIAARRIKLDWRTGVWPTLYILFASQSGRVSKTDALNYGKRILKECGLDFFLAPDESTPQALISSMAGDKLPTKYRTMSPDKKEKWRKRLAYSGQKGWAYNEWGDMLTDIVNGKNANSMFYRVIKQLYDNPEVYSYNTNTRGDEEIEFPGLNIVGTTTPDALVPVVQKSNFLTDGIGARFLMICPPSDLILTKSSPLGDAAVPDVIVDRLLTWHHRLGDPTCRIEEERDMYPPDVEEISMSQVGEKPAKRGSSKLVIEKGDLPQTVISWETSGVPEAYEQLREALAKMIVEHNLNKHLHSNYVRMPDTVLRIAMLFASLENHDTMTLAHWYRALQLVDRWRGELHALLTQIEDESTETIPQKNYGEVEQEIIAVIDRLLKKKSAIVPRNLIDSSRMLRSQGVPAIRKVLDELVAEGRLERVETAQGDGKRKSQFYRYPYGKEHA